MSGQPDKAGHGQAGREGEVYGADDQSPCLLLCRTPLQQTFQSRTGDRGRPEGSAMRSVARPRAAALQTTAE